MSEHIDVLIVNYLTADLTKQAVRSVSGPGVHTWISDNSPGHSPLREWDMPGPGGILFNPSNRYYAKANNDLLQMCSAEFILLCNPDVVCDWSGLQDMANALKQFPEAWGVVPHLLGFDGADQMYYRRLPTLTSMLADRLPMLRHVLRRSWSRYIYADMSFASVGVVEAPPSACLLLRRSWLDGRLFDERYPLFFNDTDLARRMNATGCCLFLPHVRVKHLKGASLAEERKRRRYSVARQYDLDALSYARLNIRGWPLLMPVLLSRAWICDLLARRRVR